ncbi:MAG: hypothetical protein KKG60_03115 [Nanoarchaeota archaeon]|nr:hypothetical protein [Nanoarchaeota archaeon]
MLKIFGFLDLITGVSVLLTKVGLGREIVIFCSLVVLVKSLVFIKSPVSWADIVSVFIIFAAIGGWFWIGTWIAAIWLIQKGVFSLV